MEGAATREELEGVLHPEEESNPEAVPAWEQIEAGRYMPRRIRGSCRGRSLG
jgi:hypothetical protein